MVEVKEVEKKVEKVTPVEVKVAAAAPKKVIVEKVEAVVV